MSEGPPRGGLSLTYENLLKFKILALLHDPPYKSIIVTGPCRRTGEKILASRPGHEAEAEKLYERLGLAAIAKWPRNKANKVKISDGVASSFDRWETDNIEIRMRCFKNMPGYNIEKLKWKGRSRYCYRYSLCSPLVFGLANIFDPSIGYTRAFTLVKKDIIKCCTFRWSNRLRNMLDSIIYNTGEVDLPLLLNVFETLFEPSWYMYCGDDVDPADSRAPTHSIFDHLYATASTVNIVAPAKDNEIVAGLLVGVSAAPLRDWLAASRKLGDLWIASWLASVMVWYTVKDLVWCLGPDILLLPGFRWNQLYYTLLKERLGENYALVKDVVEGFGFFEGFPYYAWQPAFQVLFLPIIRSDRASADYGECNKVVEKKLYTSKRDTFEALEEIARKVEDYLRYRFREAWRHVVEAVEEEAPKKLGEFIGKLKDTGLLDEPPLELIVAVKHLYVDGKENYVEAKKVYAKGFNELMAEMEEKEARVLPGWARNRRLQYITGGVDVPSRPIVTDRIDREIREHRWRSCSVCKHAPAVLWVPGRDLPSGEVTSDYKEWAMRVLCDNSVDDLETCWRMWRPIFKPGERLCPYCLIKRLLGLNEVFKELGNKLLGVEPEKEVSFPSTSDVAGLSVKIALLKLASMIVVGDLEVNDTYREIIEKEIVRDLSVGLKRSSIHERLRKPLVNGKGGRRDLFDSIEELIEGRWWTPRLLWFSVKDLYDKIRVRKDTIDEWKLKFSAAVLLFVDSELEEALYDNAEAREALRKLSKILKEARANIEDKSKLKIIDVIREVLVSPRKYYSIIWFDGDRYGLLKRGILGTDIGKSVDEISVREYLRKLFDTVYKDMDRIEKSTQYYSKLKESKKILDAYIGEEVRIPNSLVESCENGGIPCGSVIVSPAYHYALANAVSYTSLRAAIVAERLGGIPVYMAGDEGLIIAPTWLPWELLPDGVRAGYRREIRRALGLNEDKVEDLVSSNPALTISLIVRRIYWASSSRVPGFHPVKKRGMGRVYWRIPAIVSNGLSMGVRFAHYKDIMYDELWLTRHLLEEAKATVKDRVWMGDSVALSYGRPGHTVFRGHGLDSIGNVYSKIPSTLETIKDPVKRVRTAGLFLAAADLIAGLVEKGIVSNSLFTDKEQLLGGEDKARHVWRKAFDYGEAHVKNMLRYLFDRNIALNKRSRVEREAYLNIIDRVTTNILEALQGVEPDTLLLVFEELFNVAHMALKSMRSTPGE